MDMPRPQSGQDGILSDKHCLIVADRKFEMVSHSRIALGCCIRGGVQKFAETLMGKTIMSDVEATDTRNNANDNSQDRWYHTLPSAFNLCLQAN